MNLRGITNRKSKKLLKTFADSYELSSSPIFFFFCKTKYSQGWPRVYIWEQFCERLIRSPTKAKKIRSQHTNQPLLWGTSPIYHIPDNNTP